MMNNYKGYEFYVGSDKVSDLAAELFGKLGLDPKRKKDLKAIKTINKYIDEVHSEGWSEGYKEKEYEVEDY